MAMEQMRKIEYMPMQYFIKKGGLPMFIIKIESQENGQYLFQSQSHRTGCWEEGYVTVPPEKEASIIDCMGYGDLIVEDGQFVDFIPKPELVPTVDLKPNIESRVSELEIQLAETDEVAIELYEAIIEIYEMMGSVING